jgi:deoxyribonuclease V
MRPIHSWRVSPARAVAIQERLRGRVETRDRLGPVRHVAGIDISVTPGPRAAASRRPAGGFRARAAVVVLSFPGLEVVETSVVECPCRFPYVPGLLAFREGPSILAAFRRLRTRPDLLVFDGQGIAHPRRFGIASHIGVLLDLPSIGCAKSRLIGTHAEPGRAAGSWAPLVDGGETVGAVLRTREGVRPVYVSAGHRVSLGTAVDFVARCGRGLRLPEPTRLAHRAAGTSAVTRPAIEPTA